jgi:hypothetical protein
MSRASEAGNGVMRAVIDICNLYGVPYLRLQSRTFIVPGVGGRERPFFVGEWIDQNGVKHRKGMSDILLQPRITMLVAARARGEEIKVPLSFTVPLWVECKAGTGALTEDQKDFRDWVLSIGAAYLCVTDSCDELMQWFKDHRVEKQ